MSCTSMSAIQYGPILYGIYQPVFLIKNDEQINSDIDFSTKSMQFQITMKTDELKPKKLRCPKRKVPLSNAEQMFKQEYYNIFTTKKKFPKSYVKYIHDFFLMPNLKIPPMSREEIRRIDLYFVHNQKYQNEILSFLRQHQKEIMPIFSKENFV